VFSARELSPDWLIGLLPADVQSPDRQHLGPLFLCPVEKFVDQQYHAHPTLPNKQNAKCFSISRQKLVLWQGFH
jgi:hypothetical protein